MRYNIGPASDRITLVQGDLRAPLPPGLAPPGGFDLITGTPPYIPLGGGGSSGRPQKAPCNLETRGGVEGYVEAAAAALAPDGVIVVCMVSRGRVPLPCMCRMGEGVALVARMLTAACCC